MGADFTREAHITLSGRNATLIDCPDSEGKEALVSKATRDALSKSHTIFYITPEAKPPQTSHSDQKGAFERIKEPLSEQCKI